MDLRVKHKDDRERYVMPDPIGHPADASPHFVSLFMDLWVNPTPKDDRVGVVMSCLSGIPLNIVMPDLIGHP